MITDDDGLPRFVDLEDPLWARGAKGTEMKDGPTAHVDYTPLEVKRGTLVLFHGNLMHTSGRNDSEEDRMAYMFSIIEGTLHYPPDGYLKSDQGFDRL